MPARSPDPEEPLAPHQPAEARGRRAVRRRAPPAVAGRRPGGRQSVRPPRPTESPDAWTRRQRVGCARRRDAPPTSPASTPDGTVIGSFQRPTSRTPTGSSFGPDGNLWVTQAGGCRAFPADRPGAARDPLPVAESRIRAEDRRRFRRQPLDGLGDQAIRIETDGPREPFTSRRHGRTRDRGRRRRPDLHRRLRQHTGRPARDRRHSDSIPLDGAARRRSRRAWGPDRRGDAAEHTCSPDSRRLRRRRRTRP